MRKRTRFFVTASMFAMAMNMNGCGVYGPPEEFAPWQNMEQTAYGVPYYYEEPTATVSPLESGWYKLTQRTFAVLRIVSVPQEIPDGEEIENVVYGIEMLSFYDTKERDLSQLSKISLKVKDRYLFSEGDVLFAELGTTLQVGDEAVYQIQYAKDRPVYTGFEHDGEEYRLKISSGFMQQVFYEYLYDFNAYTEWNYKVNQVGRKDTAGEPAYFEDGMTVEEAALFFDAIKKAK